MMSIRFFVLFFCVFGLLDLIIASNPNRGKLPKFDEKMPGGAGPITRSKAKLAALKDPKIVEMEKEIVPVSNRDAAYNIFWKYDTIRDDDDKNPCNSVHFKSTDHFQICHKFTGNYKQPECKTETIERLDRKDHIITASRTFQKVLRCKTELKEPYGTVLLIPTPVKYLYYTATRNDNLDFELSGIVQIIYDPVSTAEIYEKLQKSARGSRKRMQRSK